MTGRLALAAIVVLMAPCMVRAEAKIGDFFGDWRGVDVTVAGAEPALELTPADLDTTIAPEGRGFAIRSFALTREADGGVVTRRMDATFAPTETPGVFAFDPGRRSLLSSLFADPAVGNPLEGDTLAWARLEGNALHVYSLAIDTAGGYALEQSTGRLTDDGMIMRYELRSENDHVVTVEGRLERAGD